MARILRWFVGAVLLLLVIAVAAGAFALSRDSACDPSPALASGATPMKAIVRRCYGPPDVLALADVEKPVPADNQVLVKVHAVAVNPFDWHYMRGKPYLMRLEAGIGKPGNPRLGVDFAGTVEGVGKRVTQFKTGDEVFGGRFGAFAEYLTIAEDGQIAKKPPNLSFEQAAAVNMAAMTALQALRDRGRVGPGQEVLINGASGGVGTFAVQIARWMGADVTGVCSTHNIEMVRSLGAAHVIDYTKEDFTRSGKRYDVVMDNVANRALTDIRRVLKPDGKYVLIGGGGPDAGPWIGPFILPVKALVMSWFVDEDLGMYMAHTDAGDLAILGDLMRDGQVKPVVDRTYPLADAVDAMRYLEAGHARGKVILEID